MCEISSEVIASMLQSVTGNDSKLFCKKKHHNTLEMCKLLPNTLHRLHVHGLQTDLSAYHMIDRRGRWGRWGTRAGGARYNIVL